MRSTHSYFRGVVPAASVVLSLMSGCSFAGKILQSMPPPSTIAVDDVQVSPDGRRVLFTMTKTVESEGRHRRGAHIYMANACGSNPSQISSGVYSCTGSRWSPDGKWVAFTTRRRGMDILCVMRSNGSKIRALTDPFPIIAGYRWSPDGRRIAFVAADSVPEMAARISDRDLMECPDIPSRSMNRLRIVTVDPGMVGMPVARPLTDRQMHVVCSGPVTAFDWSPDGRRIALVHRPKPESWQLNDISTVDTETGEISLLACTDAAEIMPFYSPDGRWIAYVSGPSDPDAAEITFDIYLVPACGGEPRALAVTPDRWPTIIGWHRNGRSVYFTEHYGGMTHLATLPIDGTQSRVVTRRYGRMHHITMNTTRTMIGFTARQKTGQPYTVYITPVDRYAPISIRSPFNNLFPDNPRR